ncbi:hypothetical protein MINTM020_25360 [Mycobacterium paraintracellulare]|uniref:hypothetical protein n=1 Tax=Mycobacterium paraintracellulare TaxID=1138383 RepID=UPI0019277FD6|nr:hypothetical protein [Mycobacterium paraintracellulare]BCP10438.1 hypothetical protein MINTM020_25360 [Mycobacterium paraintracellulare]
MTEIDELNAALEPYGYALRTFALHDSNFQVVRLDGYQGHEAQFQDSDGVRRFLDRLATEDGDWWLDLDQGSVQVDRTTGEVTPQDGGKPFNLADVRKHHTPGATGRSGNTPPQVGSGDLRSARSISIRSVKRPDYAGLWFKRLL